MAFRVLHKLAPSYFSNHYSQLSSRLLSHKVGSPSKFGWRAQIRHVYLYQDSPSPVTERPPTLTRLKENWERRWDPDRDPLPYSCLGSRAYRWSLTLSSPAALTLGCEGSQVGLGNAWLP